MLPPLEAGRMDPFLVSAVRIQIGVCFSPSGGDVLLTDPKEGVFKSGQEWGNRW